MQFAKQIYGNDETYSNVDIYHKKKYHVSHYLDFLTNLPKDSFHLAEIPLFPSPLIVDVDIKEEYTGELKPLYNQDVIDEIIFSYAKVLDDNLIVKQQSYTILLLEKKERIKDEKFIKHGFHLHFLSVALGKKDLQRVYELACENSEYSDYLDDVSTKPWLLYGASKSPGEEPYKISSAFIFKDDEITRVDDYKQLFYGEKYSGIEITTENVDKYIPAILSVRAVKNFTLQTPNNIKEFEIPKLTNNKRRIPVQQVDMTIPNHKIAELVMRLNKERATVYKEWLSVAMILTSIAKIKSCEDDVLFLKGVFLMFSGRADNYNEYSCLRKWDSLMTSYVEYGLGIGSLIYMAQKDSDVDDVREILYDFCIDYIPIDDYDIAEMVKNSITKSYITHKDYGCFELESTVWKEVSGHDSVFKKHISSWAVYYIKRMKSKILALEIPIDSPEYEKSVKEPMKRINILSRKTKNYNSLSSVYKALFDLYFDEKVELLFEQKPDFIAFKNCVFDIKNWKLVPANPEFYFKNRIEHDLIEWNDVPKEDKEFVLDFWKKIFPDDSLREYCVQNFSRILTGENTFKQFQFWTGIGNNGKSVCIYLMEQIFGRMCMKMPKSMVTGVDEKQGAANPELFRLKDARLAIVDEVTKNETLHPSKIKLFAGNDSLYGRDLYQKSKDIKEILPMFFPIIITNEIPLIKKPDDATWGRIRLIPFESVFKSNVDEYIEKNPSVDRNTVFKSDPRINTILKSKAKYFLSHFVHEIFKYETFDSYNYNEIIPNKVIEGLVKFKQGQNIIKQFIDENYVIDETSQELFTTNKLLRDYNATRPKITLSIEEFRVAIENYGQGITLINSTTIKGLKKVEY